MNLFHEEYYEENSFYSRVHSFTGRLIEIVYNIFYHNTRKSYIQLPSRNGAKNMNQFFLRSYNLAIKEHNYQVFKICKVECYIIRSNNFLGTQLNKRTWIDSTYHINLVYQFFNIFSQCWTCILPNQTGWRKEISKTKWRWAISTLAVFDAKLDLMIVTGRIADCRAGSTLGIVRTAVLYSLTQSLSALGSFRIETGISRYNEK